MSQRTNDPGLFEPTSSIGPVDRTDPAADRRRFFRRPRQTRVVIRKVGPWSVLKFSLLFYFCIMLVILLALGMLYSVLGAIGALDSVTKLAREVLSEKTFEVHGDWIFTRLTLIGIAMVFLWSLINVFVAFLYNLISDVVGGIEVTLAERR
jgi:quinol-cytochrome oxidoreductase complex cytochrome b subunit